MSFSKHVYVLTVIYVLRCKVNVYCFVFDVQVQNIYEIISVYTLTGVEIAHYNRLTRDDRVCRQYSY